MFVVFVLILTRFIDYQEVVAALQGSNDDPQDRHVPRPERDARPDPGQDQVRLESADPAQARDECREDPAGQDPGDDAKDADQEELLEREALQGVDDVLVVDEPRQDEDEDDEQDAEDDRDAHDRVPSARGLRLGQRGGGRVRVRCCRIAHSIPLRARRLPGGESDVMVRGRFVIRGAAKPGRAG